MHFDRRQSEPSGYTLVALDLELACAVRGGGPRLVGRDCRQGIARYEPVLPLSGAFDDRYRLAQQALTKWVERRQRRVDVGIVKRANRLCADLDRRRSQQIGSGVVAIGEEIDRVGV